jgi:hypothetical protein
MKTILAIVVTAACLAVACLNVSPAHARGASVLSGSLTCTLTPWGFATVNGCKSTTADFAFDANFTLTSSPPPSFQAVWSITSVAGDPPQIGSGCTSTSAHCDLLLTTTSSSDTRVSVTVNIYAMPAHTLVMTGEATAIAPCTTFTPTVHPRKC